MKPATTMLLVLALAAVAAWAARPATMPASAPTTRPAATPASMPAAAPTTAPAQTPPAEQADPILQSAQRNRVALQTLDVQPSAAQSSDDLQNLIRQLNSISLPGRRSHPEDVGEIEKPAATSPRSPASQPAASRPATQPAPDRDDVHQLLARLDELPPDPRRLALLGDALFQGGHEEVASAVYQRAATLETDGENLAWLVYQQGNCLRRSDPQAALDAYARVLQKFPQSPWTQAANLQAQVLRWRVVNRPQEVIQAVSQLSLPATQPAWTATQPVATHPAASSRPAQPASRPAQPSLARAKEGKR